MSSTANPSADWQLIWFAYEYLRDHDLTEQSEISRLLREKKLPRLRQLTAQALREIAALFQKRYINRSEHLQKNAACFQYLFCLSIATGLQFYQIDPSKFSEPPNSSPGISIVNLQRVAQQVETDSFGPITGHPFTMLVRELAMACNYANLPLEKISTHLLTNLKQQPYLQNFFATL